MSVTPYNRLAGWADEVIRMALASSYEQALRARSDAATYERYIAELQTELQARKERQPLQ